MLLQIWSTVHFKPLDEGKANLNVFMSDGVASSWYLPEDSGAAAATGYARTLTTTRPWSSKMFDR